MSDIADDIKGSGYPEWYNWTCACTYACPVKSSVVRLKKDHLAAHIERITKIMAEKIRLAQNV